MISFFFFLGKLFSIYEFQSEALKTDDDHFLDGWFIL